jgi:hypothetical protein
MKESDVQTLVQLRATRAGAVTFRNNVGQGWVGRSTRQGRMTIIQDARPLHAGLCEGSADLIGWTSVDITPEMVGRRVAVFTAIETKAARGRATAEQLNFISRVLQAGGFAGIARAPEDVATIIQRNEK